MCQVKEYVDVIGEVLRAIVQRYEEHGILPNMCGGEDRQSMLLTISGVVNNPTFVITVIEQSQGNYFLDLTAYFANKDYVFPEGAPEGSAVYVIRAAPQERIFTTLYEVVGDSLPEAFCDAFYVILEALNDIVSALVGENEEE